VQSQGFFLAIIFLLRKEVNELAVVNLRNGESQDQLLKRFRKKVVKSGVLSTVRRKRWFVSRTEQRRMEKKKAARRSKRKQYTRDYDRS
jgi:small subunit ribosomal protein S21